MKMNLLRGGDSKRLQRYRAWRKRHNQVARRQRKCNRQRH